jgi:hypothetical protein
MSCSASSAVVIPFAPPVRAGNRMSVRDKIVALEWADTARDAGYTRIALDTSASADEPELGDFLLIYEREAMWANWGVGCCDGGYMIWRPSDGATIGWYPTLEKALAAIPPAE